MIQLTFVSFWLGDLLGTVVRFPRALMKVVISTTIKRKANYGSKIGCFHGLHYCCSRQAVWDCWMVVMVLRVLGEFWWCLEGFRWRKPVVCVFVQGQGQWLVVLYILLEVCMGDFHGGFLRMFWWRKIPHLFLFYTKFLANLFWLSYLNYILWIYSYI